MRYTLEFKRENGSGKRGNPEPSSSAFQIWRVVLRMTRDLTGDFVFQLAASKDFAWNKYPATAKIFFLPELDTEAGVMRAA